MTNELKNMNSNVIASALDSGEEVQKGSCFLKSGEFLALWSTVENYVRGSMIEKKNVDVQSC